MNLESESSYPEVRELLERATAQGLLPESIDIDSEIKRTNGLTGALVTAIDDLVDEHYRDENEELPDDCQEMWEVKCTALLSLACLNRQPIQILDGHANFLLKRDRDAAGKPAELPIPPEVFSARLRRTVNRPVPSYLLGAILDFALDPRVRHLLPPLLYTAPDEARGAGSRADTACQGSSTFLEAWMTTRSEVTGRSISQLEEDDRRAMPEKAATRKMVMAMLDGGTPLHFAAAAGALENVDWLLKHGADLQARTLAGELPIQMVPGCGKTSAHNHCRCSSQSSHCASRRTRSAMAYQGIARLAGGMGSWIAYLVYSLLCLLGLWGCYTSVHRPGVEKYAKEMEERQRLEAQEEARRLVHALRSKARETEELLQVAMPHYGPKGTRFDQGEPGGDTAMTRRWQGKPGKMGVNIVAKDKNLGSEAPEHTAGRVDGDLVIKQEPEVDTKKLLSASKLSVHKLQDLKLTPVKAGGKRQKDCPQKLVDNLKLGEEIGDCHVSPSAQAAIFMRMALAVYIDFRARGCTADDGPAAPGDFMEFAVLHGKRLLDRMEKAGEHYPGGLQGVGVCYAHIMHSSICLMLAEQASCSATPQAVGFAKGLLKRWEYLEAKGHVASANLSGDFHVECLEAWWRNKAADLDLAVALRGRELQATESLAVAVEECITRDPGGAVRLRRNVTKDMVIRLTAALAAESAADASEHLLEMVRGVAETAGAEVACAEQLRGCLRSNSGQGGSHEALQHLEATIAHAANFPRLKEEAAAASRTLQKRKLNAEAARRLDADVEEARIPPCLPETPPGSQAYWEACRSKIHTLVEAIDRAQESSVSVGGARKVLKEMRGQVAAAEAAENLDALLASSQLSSTVMKTALQSAEGTLAEAGTGHLGGHSEGSATLQPVVQAARRRLEVLRTTEALQRATAGCRGLGDLHRLEQAILAARKTKDIDADVLRSASELRASLDRAVKSKSNLDLAVKALARSQRQEEASALEAAIAQAQPDCSLLQEEVKAAEEAVGRWKLLTASEAKLAKVMRDGTSSTILARVLQEAKSAGARGTAAAQKLCKALHNLEAAMQRAGEGPKHSALLGERIVQAESAGVAAAILAEARALERRAQLSEAKQKLELALRPKADRNAAARGTALQDALETADGILAAAGAAEDAAEEGVPKATPDSELCGDLRRLSAVARTQLEEGAAEQVRIELLGAEEHRLKMEKQKAEREERERERKARRVERQKAPQLIPTAEEQQEENSETAEEAVVVCKMMRPQPDQVASFQPYLQPLDVSPQPAFPDPGDAQSEAPSEDSPVSAPARLQNGQAPRGPFEHFLPQLSAIGLEALGGSGFGGGTPACQASVDPHSTPYADRVYEPSQHRTNGDAYHPGSVSGAFPQHMASNMPLAPGLHATAPAGDAQPFLRSLPFVSDGLNADQGWPDRPRSAHQLFSPYPYPLSNQPDSSSSFLDRGLGADWGAAMPRELHLPSPRAEGGYESPLGSLPSPHVSAQGVLAFGAPHLTAFSQAPPSPQLRAGRMGGQQADVGERLRSFAPFSRAVGPSISRSKTPTPLSTAGLDHNSSRDVQPSASDPRPNSRAASPSAGYQHVVPGPAGSDPAFDWSSIRHSDSVFKGLPLTLDDIPLLTPFVPPGSPPQEDSNGHSQRQ